MYLNTLVFMGKSKLHAVHNMQVARAELIKNLGFTINFDKPLFIPGQFINHLGYII